MAEINGGDPNYLLTGMIFPVGKIERSVANMENHEPSFLKNILDGMRGLRNFKCWREKKQNTHAALGIEKNS